MQHLKNQKVAKKQTKKTRTHEQINTFIFGTFRYATIRMRDLNFLLICIIQPLIEGLAITRAVLVTAS